MSYDRATQYDGIVRNLSYENAFLSYEESYDVPYGMSHDASYDALYDTKMHCRTTKYDGTSYEFRPSYSYDSLLPFRPSYDCILHSYDDFRTIACAVACG
jgi:hypothetical protein